MKNYQKLILASVAFIIHIQLLAQDIDIDLVDDTPEIFEKPIFWVIVGIVVIIVAYLFKRKK